MTPKDICKKLTVTSNTRIAAGGRGGELEAESGKNRSEHGNQKGVYAPRARLTWSQPTFWGSHQEKEIKWMAWWERASIACVLCQIYFVMLPNVCRAPQFKTGSIKKPAKRGTIQSCAQSDTVRTIRVHFRAQSTLDPQTLDKRTAQRFPVAATAALLLFICILSLFAQFHLLLHETWGQACTPSQNPLKGATLHLSGS